MITLLILNWNGKQDTLECLRSLESVQTPLFEVILIDNGSSDDSVETFRKEFPQHTLIANTENLGFAEGNNIGIRLALERGSDYILLLNNDTIVDPNFLTPLLETFEQFPKAGIVGGKLLLASQPETLDHFGGMWNPKTGVFDLVGLRENEASWQTPFEIDYACGACMMVKAEVFLAVGLLEPRFFLIWEESDLAFRAKQASFLTLIAPKSCVRHKVSVSFTGGKPHSTYFWWRNRLLWIERNCSLGMRISLYVRVLIPKILQMLKLHILKTVQLFFCPLEKKRQFLKKNRAALIGVRDYFFRRFGKGPSWLHK
jgi:hypothetical protein